MITGITTPPCSTSGGGNPHWLRWWSQKVSCKFSSFEMQDGTPERTTEKRIASKSSRRVGYHDNQKVTTTISEVTIKSTWNIPICWKMYFLLKMVPFSVDFVGFSTWKVLIFFVRHVSVSRGGSRSKMWSFLLLLFFPFRLKPRLAKGDKDWQNRNGQNVCLDSYSLGAVLKSFFWAIAINHHRLNAFGFKNTSSNAGTRKSKVFSR